MRSCVKVYNALNKVKLITSPDQSSRITPKEDKLACFSWCVSASVICLIDSFARSDVDARPVTSQDINGEKVVRPAFYSRY